jgi:hypothetical protein
VNKKSRWTKKKTETRKEAQRGKSLPRDHKWEDEGAKREKKKGRATGGIITGVKVGIKEKGEEEGCMERKVQ